MNCNKCGAPLMENDKFCKGCGTAVNASNIQNNVGINTQNGFNNMQQPMNNNMVEQPANGYQQPANNYNNGYASQPAYNQSPKNNNTKFIFIGVGVAILIALIILIFVLLGNKNNEGPVNGGSSLGENGNTPVVNNTSNYTAKFKGFTFKIPTNLVYETKEDLISIGDEEGTWAVYVEVLSGSYSQIVANKNQLQTNIQAMGYTSSAPVEKTIGSMPFVTLEISKGGTNAILGVTKANSMNLFGITAYNLDNEYDYSSIETVSSILKSAEYTGETNNMSAFEKIDMSGISELAQ